MPAPAPSPGVIATGWVTAPLQVGGYACNRLQLGDPKTPPCGQGIVLRITGTVPNSSAYPNGSAPAGAIIYTAVFQQDLSGQFPVNDAYDVSFVGYWPPEALQGIAPAPSAPAMLMRGERGR